LTAKRHTNPERLQIGSSPMSGLQFIFSCQETCRPVRMDTLWGRASTLDWWHSPTAVTTHTDTIFFHNLQLYVLWGVHMWPPNWIFGLQWGQPCLLGEFTPNSPDKSSPASTAYN